MRPLPLLLSAALVVTAASSTGASAQQVSDSNAFLNAVRDKDGAVATRLLETGGSTVLSARNGDGDTGLHIAIRRRDAGWIGFLLARNADPNLTSRQGEPPLVLAARLGFIDGVNLLLREGAKVDAANRQGETALIAAVQSANTPGARSALPVVQRLLRAGANPKKTDSAAGYSALDYARQDRRSAAILRALEETSRPALSSAPSVVPAEPPTAAPASNASVPKLTHPNAQMRTLQAYIFPPDYPQAALASRQEGVVDVRLKVAPSGRVVECTAEATPPSAVLAASTCRILRSRTRFSPALDDSGQPTTGTVTDRVVWSLPR